MRAILAAGGSGGHIFPAVALAAELGKKGVEEIFFVSSKRRLDRNILKLCGHRCFFLSVNPMPLRFAPVRAVVFAVKLLTDVAVSVYLMARLRPSVVVGFGGYSSGAIVSAARMFGVPVLIHEQNLSPGRANRILSHVADRVAVSFMDSVRYFTGEDHKIVFSGNPLRVDMLSNDRERAVRELGLSPEKLTVLVMGGSQGAAFLNGIVSEAARFVKNKKGDTVQFIHLTGNRDHERIKRFYEEHGISGRVFSFLERIDVAYAACDLAVSRSGAAAVFELAYYAKPMILVPYPNPKNNQRSNAIYFSRAGAAVYKEEKGLSFRDLAGEMLGILTNDTRRADISRAAGKLSVPDAGKKLAEEVIKLGREG